MDQLINASAPPGPGTDPAAGVTALYAAHALGLIHLAVIMVGDRQAAEDVVQDAFLGLYGRWGMLRGQDKALSYVRSSVFNGCRTLLRQRARRRHTVFTDVDAESAESRALVGEEHREVLAALRRLPDRQREAVALRYGETITGKTVAMYGAQSNRSFVGVTGAADDRTFVVDTVEPDPKNPVLWFTAPRTFYLLRLDSAGVGKLAKLAIPATPDASKVDGISLSPDGSKLAVPYQVGNRAGGYPYSGPFELRIYSVASGALLHAWTGRDPHHGTYGYGGGDSPPDDNLNLTWTADGRRLAFAYRSSNSPDSSLYLRQLDLASPGTDLFADSKLIVKVAISMTNPMPDTWCDSLGITADGKTALCGANLPALRPRAAVTALGQGADNAGCSPPTAAVTPGFAEYSTATDKLTKVVYEVPGSPGPA